MVRVKVNELPVPSDYPLFIDAVETKRKKYSPATDIHFQEDERTQTWYVSCAFGVNQTARIFFIVPMMTLPGKDSLPRKEDSIE